MLLGDAAPDFDAPRTATDDHRAGLYLALLPPVVLDLKLGKPRLLLGLTTDLRAPPRQRSGRDAGSLGKFAVGQALALAQREPACNLVAPTPGISAHLEQRPAKRRRFQVGVKRRLHHLDRPGE